MLFSLVANSQTSGDVTIKNRLWFDNAWHSVWPYNNSIVGGVVTWQSGLTFAVSPARYTIGKNDYGSQAGTITLNAADATNPRLDVIALNTSGQIIKLTGTPSPTPAIPQVNAATQIYLTSVFIAAGATTPGGVTSLTIYDENTEFAHDEFNFNSINFNSTTTPQNGTKTIAATGSGDIKFAAPTPPYYYNDYSVLRFYIRLTTAFPANGRLQIALSNGDVPMTTIGTAEGFNPATVGTYQNISVPMSSISKNTNTFTAFYLSVTGVTGSYLIDNIRLQGGVGGGTGAGYVTDVYQKTGTDSIFIMVNGVPQFRYRNTGGGGGGSTTMGTVGSSPNANAGTITSGVLTLQPASASFPGIVTTGTQTFAGSKSFNNDIRANSVSFGKALFPSASNIVVGVNVASSPTGTSNSLIGYNNGASLTSGSNNVCIGPSTANSLTTGSNNVILGYQPGNMNLTTGSDNTIIGGNGSASILASIGNPSNNVIFAAGNTIPFRIFSDGSFTHSGGKGKYTAHYGIATTTDIPDVADVDSLLNKKLADSGFAVVRPVTNGNVSLFSTISSTKLQLSDLKNSASITWVKNADSTISGTATGSLTLAQVDSIVAKKLLDSAFIITTPVASTVAIAAPVSTTQLVIRGLKNSNDVGFILNGDSTISAYLIKQKQTITTGTATTLNNNINNAYIDPASLLSTHTITMPATPTDGQEITILFGGTIAAGSNVVTTLTISANTGQTLYQSLTPTTAKGGDVMVYQYNSLNTKWYRIK